MQAQFQIGSLWEVKVSKRKSNQQDLQVIIKLNIGVLHHTKTLLFEIHLLKSVFGIDTNTSQKYN